MVVSLKKPRALTIFVQISTVMLIFCLVGNAIGSCVRYGHSCWGAHGKRSDIPTMSILSAKILLNGSPQNGIAPSFKTQWILSRLTTRQPLPLMDKYRVRWDGFPKDKPYVLSKWDHDMTSTTNEDFDSTR